jgi:hypothetical protein
MRDRDMSLEADIDDMRTPLIMRSLYTIIPNEGLKNALNKLLKRGL